MWQSYKIHCLGLNQWFPNFLACDSSYKETLQMSELFTITPKRHFHSQLLKWFHLNNSLRPKEVKWYCTLVYKKYQSSKHTIQMCVEEHCSFIFPIPLIHSHPPRFDRGQPYQIRTTKVYKASTTTEATLQLQQ